VTANRWTGLAHQLRVGTRRSALARTQSQWLAETLQTALDAAGCPIEVELVEITTHGDVSAAPLHTLGGTGVFVSSLRDALVAGEIDLAVHSLKDLPTGSPEGLALGAVPVREDPRDVLVARDGLTLAQLPAGSRVGTGSPRRAAQIRALGLGLDVVGIRGNVDTRIAKVHAGEVDAVVLARAGLLRLGRAAEATEVFDPLVMLSAPGQGALAVECNSEAKAVLEALELVDDPATRASVLAERALLARLEAGCAAPVGALADVAEGDDGWELSLRAVVAAPDGSDSIRRSAVMALEWAPPDRSAVSPGVLPEGDAAAAMNLGRALAEQMLEDGAEALMPAPTGSPDNTDTALEGDS
jgi:hydroxymethylbilane synthase